MNKVIRKTDDGCVYVTIGNRRLVFKDGKFVYAYNFVNPIWR